MTDTAARPSPLADAPELCRFDAATLTRRYADRSLSPVEATAAALARAEAIQPRFNAFSHLDPEGALALLAGAWSAERDPGRKAVR